MDTQVSAACVKTADPGLAFHVDLDKLPPSGFKRVDDLVPPARRARPRPNAANLPNRNWIS